MGIISRENAAAVAPFSFSEERGDVVEASTWQLGNEDQHALPAPTAPTAGQQHDVASSGTDPSVDGPVDGDAIPVETAQPPIVQVPEEVLAAFYDQVVLTGLEDGRNQVLAELNILQERFAAALEGLGAVSQQLASQNQVQIMTLACQIAGRLVREEIQLRPDRLLSLLEESLANQDPSDSVVVRCSAGDYEYIVSQKPHLEAGVGAAFSVRVELDETLEYGDFQIETRKGQIDGRVDVRVNEIKQVLEGAEHV